MDEAKASQVFMAIPGPELDISGPVVPGVYLPVRDTFVPDAVAIEIMEEVEKSG